MAKNENLETVTNEIDQEVKKATSHPVYGRFLSPLRLMVVWVKAVNTELREIRAYMNSDERKPVTIENGEG